MDYRVARAGAAGIGLLYDMPSLAGVPRLTPTSVAPGQVVFDPALQAYAQKLYTQAYDEVDALGGDIDTFGSPAFQAAYKWNGTLWSIGVSIPFPTVLPEHFPGLVGGKAPGEIPFDQCANYRTDGLNELAVFEAKYKAYGENDVVSGGITKKEMRLNIKKAYNDESAAHGCSSIPFPEAVGWVPVAEHYPEVPTISPTPVNTFTPADGGPPVVLVDDGSNVPLDDPYTPPPRPPTVIPDPNDTTPNTSTGPDDSSSGPVTTTPTGSGGASSMWGLLALGGVALLLLRRKR